LYSKYKEINSEEGSQPYKEALNQEFKMEAELLRSKFDENCTDKSNIEALVKSYNTHSTEQIDEALACGTH